jgi:hypothetical protein
MNAQIGPAGTGDGAADDTGQVLTFKMHRVRKGMHLELSETPPAAGMEAEAVRLRRPSRAAIMLALAHKIQQAIDEGRIKDRAEVAARLGVTRARVTQMMNLTLLPVAVQGGMLEVMGVRSGLSGIGRRDRSGPRP